VTLNITKLISYIFLMALGYIDTSLNKYSMWGTITAKVSMSLSQQDRCRRERMHSIQSTSNTVVANVVLFNKDTNPLEALATITAEPPYRLTEWYTSRLEPIVLLMAIF